MILCIIDIVVLSPNIPLNKGLTYLRKLLESSDNKQISNSTLIELAEIVLKNNFFEFDKKTS